MSEKEIRRKFKERGYKIVRVTDTDFYRVYYLKEKIFVGERDSLFTLQELSEVAECNNFLKFMAMI